MCGRYGLFADLDDLGTQLGFDPSSTGRLSAPLEHCADRAGAGGGVGRWHRAPRADAALGRPNARMTSSVQHPGGNNCRVERAPRRLGPSPVSGASQRVLRMADRAGQATDAVVVPA